MVSSLYAADMIFYYTNSMAKFTRNCEDIAMSFLVANATDAPPIWVKGKI